MKKQLAKLLWLVAFMCFLAAHAFDAFGQQEENKAPLNPANPGTWQRAVDRVGSDREVLSLSLISVAKDGKRHPEERRQAILLIGQVGTKAGLEFLVAHIGMKIPLRAASGDERLLGDFPCKHALYRSAENWAAVPIILQVLDAQKSDEDLLHLVGVLKRALTYRLAQEIVIFELEKTRFILPARKRNLELMKKYLERN